MPISGLRLQGIRNLVPQAITPCAGINLLAGPNGAGKTSILEAICLLGRGRSFRARSINAVVAYSADHCTVFGLIDVTDGRGNQTQRRLGVSRETGGGFHFKVDGTTVTAASALADILPLVLINSDSFALLEGSPQGRRRYLDWGVFHTVPASRELWRQHQRAHQQRNTLLRQSRIDRQQLTLWDERLAAAGEAVTRYRRDYALEIHPIIERVLSEITPDLGELRLGFHPGWDAERSLAEALGAHREKDIMQGSTQVGPHRADLRVRLDRRVAAEALSRGQTKMLVIAMLMAQGIHYQERCGNACVSLLDDLPAELDPEHRRRVARLVSSTGQAFVTGTDASLLLAAWADSPAELKLFHVEQGRLADRSSPDSPPYRESL
ncbi:MAG: DNA replication/repair protein RecF [Gammaproteobacteria bacterium]|nr:DNA replication/repair protein RecF [Gammaproteobacteria bacterium]